MTHRFPSDIAKLPPSRRVRAYLRLVRPKADGGDGWQDSLRLRIDAGVGLTDNEVAAVLCIVGHRCRAETKERLERALRRVPHVRSFGIYERLLLGNACTGHADYCAGQDYTSEIRTLRECLLAS